MSHGGARLAQGVLASYGVCWCCTGHTSLAQDVLVLHGVSNPHMGHVAVAHGHHWGIMGGLGGTPLPMQRAEPVQTPHTQDKGPHSPGPSPRGTPLTPLLEGGSLLMGGARGPPRVLGPLGGAGGKNNQAESPGRQAGSSPGRGPLLPPAPSPFGMRQGGRRAPKSGSPCTPVPLPPLCEGLDTPSPGGGRTRVGGLPGSAWGPPLLPEPPLVPPMSNLGFPTGPSLGSPWSSPPWLGPWVLVQPSQSLFGVPRSWFGVPWTWFSPPVPVWGPSKSQFSPPSLMSPQSIPPRFGVHRSQSSPPPPGPYSGSPPTPPPPSPSSPPIPVSGSPRSRSTPPPFPPPPPAIPLGRGRCVPAKTFLLLLPLNPCPSRHRGAQPAAPFPSRWVPVDADGGGHSGGAGSAGGRRPGLGTGPAR